MSIVGWSSHSLASQSSAFDQGFQSNPYASSAADVTIKARLINLISAVRTLMRSKSITSSLDPDHLVRYQSDEISPRLLLNSPVSGDQYRRRHLPHRSRLMDSNSHPVDVSFTFTRASRNSTRCVCATHSVSLSPSLQHCHVLTTNTTPRRLDEKIVNRCIANCSSDTDSCFIGRCY